MLQAQKYVELISSNSDLNSYFVSPLGRLGSFYKSSLLLLFLLLTCDFFLKGTSAGLLLFIALTLRLICLMSQFISLTTCGSNCTTGLLLGMTLSGRLTSNLFGLDIGTSITCFLSASIPIFGSLGDSLTLALI